MCDADVLEAEGVPKGLEACERSARGRELAVLGKGEEVWFEDVVVGIPCFWGDRFGRVAFHWHDLMFDLKISNIIE